MNLMTLASVGSRSHSRPWVRVVVLGMLAALVVPAVLTLFSVPAAHAEEDDQNDYSLYQLASNASAYFSNENSPDSYEGGGGEADASNRLSDDWQKVTKWPAVAGSLLGYADPQFSMSLKWLFSEMSGSSQTLGYDTFAATDGEGKTLDIYKGMFDYAHFGAANADLGLDNMTSGNTNLLKIISGGLIWLVYGLAMGVSFIFWVIIKILQLLNPFLWFHKGMSGVSESYRTWADGMAQGQVVPVELQGLAGFVNDWYGVLIDLSWNAIVPLFIGFTIIGMLLFKKMDRGSAIKKLVVRVVFIGVGIPLIGSMYTQVLSKFDDSMMSEHSGATRVVLSTYVDFNQWMTVNRLAIPDEASISWNASEGHALPESQYSIRTTALAINKQAHGNVYSGISVGSVSDDAESAWTDSTVSVDKKSTDSAGAVKTTFGILNRYIGNEILTASDYESGIKGNITQTTAVDEETKRKWFAKGEGYGESKGFGVDGTSVDPPDHPLISVKNHGEGVGLDSTDSGGQGDKVFATRHNTTTDCGYAVVDESGNPMNCNMSPLAAYNYLNTTFDVNAMTMYSSNRAMSGFTRENHAAVSQIGTGPVAMMYWLNAFVLLGSIALIGLFYGIGMLVQSVRRSLGIVAASPFAILGSIAGIAKFIIYSVALILEVLVTLFVYQFAAELLISIPQIIEAPMARLVSGNQINGIRSVLSNDMIGTIAVIVLMLISILIVMGVAIALMRVRKSALKALDEAVTKVVDKFLETTTPPAAGGGGLLPAVAGGVGAGAGMAGANALKNSMGGGSGTKAAARGSGAPTGSGGTNVGGTNSDPRADGALSSGKGGPALPGGQASGSDGSGPNGPAGLDGSGGPGGQSGGNVLGRGADGTDGTGEGQEGAEGAASDADGAAARGGATGRYGDGETADVGSHMSQTSSEGVRSKDDRELAKNVSKQGGLSKLGVGAAAGGAAGAAVAAGAAGQGHHKRRARKGTGAAGTAAAGGAAGAAAVQNLGGTGGSKARKSGSSTPASPAARPAKKRSSAAVSAPSRGSQQVAPSKRARAVQEAKADLKTGVQGARKGASVGRKIAGGKGAVIGAAVGHSTAVAKNGKNPAAAGAAGMAVGGAIGGAVAARKAQQRRAQVRSAPQQPAATGAQKPKKGLKKPRH